MASEPSVTVLHISDPQFGKNHRFGKLVGGTAGDETFDTLLKRLQKALDRLKKEQGLQPDLIVLSGDLAEWGLKSEFQQAMTFLTGLTDHLGLSRDRVVIIPGNHDINRDACDSYFKECRSEEMEPDLPYWPKWKHYDTFFQTFYRDIPAYTFSEERPWTLFAIPELKVVVAGLNSTMRESHQDDDHYGWVGEAQLHWFASQLEPYREQGWLRIGAVHHNVRREAVSDDENLRDFDDLKNVLGPYLNVLLHGHTHDGKLDWLEPTIPILSTGSAALAKEARPEEVPNQFQILRFGRTGLTRWALQYAPGQKKWIGDTRVSTSGDAWVEDKPCAFSDVAGTFSDPTASEGTQRTAEGRESKRRRTSGRLREEGITRDDLLSQVESITKVEYPEATIKRISQTGAPIEYLQVTNKVDGFPTIYVVGAINGPITPEALEYFLTVHRRYRAADHGRTSILVSSEPPPGVLRDQAAAERVRLISFVEYQGLIDFRAFVDRQTQRLDADPVYPPALYVPQRMHYKVGEEVRASANTLDTLEHWLIQEGRFVLTLGDFGTGKTFLLRQLARRLGREGSPLVPILIEMRKLEKAQGLNELVAQHLTKAGMEKIDLRAFRYMLEHGRIALLFDGFDELALRVSYQRAVDHLDTLLEAARGDARVVVASRTTHFKSDRQILTALGEKLDSIVGRRIVYVQPFERDQILQFLVNRLSDEQEAEERLALFDSVQDLMGLSSNPRMLSFIADLDPEKLRAAKEETGEITAATLYEMILEHWLVFEYDRQNPMGSSAPLSVEDRWGAAEQIALHLWGMTERTLTADELPQAAAFAAERLAELQLDHATAAHQVGSGTLLIRDEEGRFSFLHQSVMEWLVARHAAGQLQGEGAADVLGQGAMSALMADFLCDLADRDSIRAWARRVLTTEASATTKKNALLLLDRLGETAREQVDASGQSLAGEDLSGRDLTGALLMDTDLTGVRLVRATLDGADLSRAILRGADLSGARLENAILTDSDLSGASLLGANIRGAQLHNANLRRTKLLGANLNMTELSSSQTFGSANKNSGRPQPRCKSRVFVNSISWSPHGDIIATSGGSDRIQIWEVTNGRELQWMQAKGRITSISFSPDGETLAIGEGDGNGGAGAVSLWEVGNGREIWRLEGGDVTSVAFNPNGNLLAVGEGGDGGVHLWDVASGQEVRWLEGGDVTSVAFSSNGRLLAAGEGGDGGARLWDVVRGREVWWLEGGDVTSVAFSPDGSLLATGGGDGVGARLWQVASGREVRWRNKEGSWIRSVAFSPTGRLLATGDGDGGAYLWDIVNGRRLWWLGDGDVTSVAFSPDGSLLATGNGGGGDGDGGTRLWEVETGREVRRLDGTGVWVRSLAFSPNSRFLASGEWGRGGVGAARLWDIESGQEIHHLEGGDVTSVAFSPDNQLLATGGGGGNGGARLWDVASGKLIRWFQGGRVASVAFSPNGVILATGANSGARLWDVASKPVREVRWLDSGNVTSVAFSPDGELLATGAINGSQLWDVVSGRAVRRLAGGIVTSVAFSPDGSLFATGEGEDGGAHLWDVASGREVGWLESGDVASVAFSPDGSLLATCSTQGSICLWEVESGHLIHSMKGHGGWTWSITFSPDGHLLATSGDDSTIKVWDPKTFKSIFTLGILSFGSVVFTDDGRYRVTGETSGEFWHSISLCRFEAGEIDSYIKGLRISDEEHLINIDR